MKASLYLRIQYRGVEQCEHLPRVRVGKTGCQWLSQQLFQSFLGRFTAGRCHASREKSSQAAQGSGSQHSMVVFGGLQTAHHYSCWLGLEWKGGRGGAGLSWSILDVHSNLQILIGCTSIDQWTQGQGIGADDCSGTPSCLKAAYLHVGPFNSKAQEFWSNLFLISCIVKDRLSSLLLFQCCVIGQQQRNDIT